MYIDWKPYTHFTEEEAKATVRVRFPIRVQVETRSRSWSLCLQPSDFSGPCLGLLYSLHTEMSSVFSWGGRARGKSQRGVGLSQEPGLE